MRLGIDIGGTKTAAVAIGLDGQLSDQLRLHTGFGADAVIETAVQAVRRMRELVGLGARPFDSIGIGVPGAVDGATGRVRHAVNLGFEGLDLGAQLAERLGFDVRIENDVKAAALGAHHLLGLADGAFEGSRQRRAQSMAYLSLGTGLAAGFVVDGRLHRGSHGIAGEIGHIPIDPAGTVCACGQRGCLETIASGSAIARRWPKGATQPAIDLFEAAGRGDRNAAQIRDEFLGGVAAAVRMLVLTMDVDSVVIGGGVSEVGDALIDGVRRTLVGWAEASPFIESLGLDRRVTIIPPGFPAAAVGAALVGASPLRPDHHR